MMNLENLGDTIRYRVWIRDICIVSSNSRDSGSRSEQVHTNGTDAYFSLFGFSLLKASVNWPT